MADMDELFGSDGDSDNDQRGNVARNTWLILFNHQFVQLDECRVVRSCEAEVSFNARVWNVSRMFIISRQTLIMLMCFKRWL